MIQESVLLCVSTKTAGGNSNMLVAINDIIQNFFHLDFVHLHWANIHLYSPFVHDVGHKQNLAMTTFTFRS